MIFIKDFTKITEEKYSIGFIHFMPFDPAYGLGKTEEELLKEGKLVEKVEPQTPSNKKAVMYYNPNGNNVFYEYEDIKVIGTNKDEINMQQRLEALEKSNAEMMNLIATLTTPVPQV